MMWELEIRPETPADASDIDRVLSAAFAGTAESRLVRRLRESGGLTLSLVAESQGELVAHIAFSPMRWKSASIDPRPLVLGLAPMAVLPGRQRAGIGAALVAEALARLAKLDCDAVLVLGHPDYYPRFGFRAASEFGLTCPYEAPPEAFMALELTEGALADAGAIRYHAAFDAF